VFRNQAELGGALNVKLGSFIENASDKNGNSRILEDITGVSGNSKSESSRKEKGMCDIQYTQGGKENIMDHTYDTSGVHEANS
jgi:hypothetical protein